MSKKSKSKIRRTSDGFLQEKFVIFTSPNGRPPWAPVPPDAVPDWVKDPDNMAELAAGKDCMDAAQGPTGSHWYRAIRLKDVVAAQKAAAEKTGDH